MIVYDCEIVKAIKGKEAIVPGIEYCQGWKDFPGMGISVIGVYDFEADQTRVFLEDNFQDFQTLVDRTDLIIGYNSIGFDNQLVAAHGISIPKSKNYDILVEIWKGAGLGPEFRYPSHVGFSLDKICELTLPNVRKSGHGAFAPILWQQGKRGQVIDYCLNDVFMTVQLVDHIMEHGFVAHPKNLGHISVISPLNYLEEGGDIEGEEPTE